MNFRNVWEDTLDVGKSVGKGLLSGTAESAINSTFKNDFLNWKRLEKIQFKDWEYQPF